MAVVLPGYTEDGLVVAVNREEIQELLDSSRAFANVTVAPSSRRQGYADCSLY